MRQFTCLVVDTTVLSTIRILRAYALIRWSASCMYLIITTAEPVQYCHLETNQKHPDYEGLDLPCQLM